MLENTEESEGHLLQCGAIVSEPEVNNHISEMQYSDIFSDVQQQIRAA